MSQDTETNKRPYPLSPDENDKAVELRQEHKYLTNQIRIRLGEIADQGVTPEGVRIAEEGKLTQDEESALYFSGVDIKGLKRDQTERDANLWQAQQHKEEHLENYIEQARRDAEADGKHINLDPPEQQTS